MKSWKKSKEPKEFQVFTEIGKEVQKDMKKPAAAIKPSKKEKSQPPKYSNEGYYQGYSRYTNEGYYQEDSKYTNEGYYQESEEGRGQSQGASQGKSQGKGQGKSQGESFQETSSWKFL